MLDTLCYVSFDYRIEGVYFKKIWLNILER